MLEVRTDQRWSNCSELSRLLTGPDVWSFTLDLKLSLCLLAFIFALQLPQKHLEVVFEESEGKNSRISLFISSDI